MNGLSFTMLGPLAAWRLGSSVHIGPARQREVLGALLLRRGTSVTIEQLALDVWGENQPAGVHNVVHTYLSRLRRMLGHNLVRSDRPGYSAVTSADSIDVSWFDAHVARARAACARGDLRTARQAMESALNLCYGNPLHGSSGPLAEAERTRLLALRQEVTTELAAVRLLLDDGEDLVPQLKGMLVEQSLNEPLWALLIASLQRSARRAEALQAFQQARSHLGEQLGVEPGRQLQQIHMMLLRDEAVPVWSRWARTPALH